MSERLTVSLDFICRYATIFTMFPVFSLVLDQDVKPEMALLYPELYKDLTKVLLQHHHLTHLYLLQTDS